MSNEEIKKEFVCTMDENEGISDSDIGLFLVSCMLAAIAVAWFFAFR